MSLFETITNQIIQAIEAGAPAYQMPWNRDPSIGLPVNAVTGRPYRGINTLLLWAAAFGGGYNSGEWATYRQWSETGAQVRKGEKATVVLLWKPRVPSEPHAEDPGENAVSGGFVSRAFCVFNAAQVEGYFPPATTVLNDKQRIAAAEAFFGQVPATIWRGSDRAFFDPASDTISMPSFERFISPGAYYSVLSHELTHWTGVKSRLARDLAGRFGGDAYALEELVAELGAAFLTAHLQIDREPRKDHAPYIASWLKALRNDPRAIVTAASKAQAAVDFLVSLATDQSKSDETSGQSLAGVAA